MILISRKKKKTMPTPILSKKSMALRVRYAKIIFFFQNHYIRLYIERVV